MSICHRRSGCFPNGMTKLRNTTILRWHYSIQEALKEDNYRNQYFESRLSFMKFRLNRKGNVKCFRCSRNAFPQFRSDLKKALEATNGLWFKNKSEWIYLRKRFILWPVGYGFAIKSRGENYDKEPLTFEEYLWPLYDLSIKESNAKKRREVILLRRSFISYGDEIKAFGFEGGD